MKKNYTLQNLYIPGPAGRLRLLVARPKHPAPGGAPGVLWLHGGGFATGMPEMFCFCRAKALAQKFGAVVVLPAYRLAPRAPYPAAVEDCFAALQYVKNHAAELGIRADQLMVGGESAGGGLCAAVCLMARDTGSVRIAFQMPLYPMLDDRDTPSSRSNRAPVWNTRRNRAAWRLYLRRIQGEPPPYAAPARAQQQSGLPPAYTFVGDAEPFYCETLTYIQRLQQAGISAAADVYPGQFHAFDMLLPRRKASRLAAQRFEAQFAYALRHYFAPQEDHT